MVAIKRIFAFILAIVILAGASGCADGITTDPTDQEPDSPLKVVQLLNTDASTVRRIMVESFGSENLKSGYRPEWMKADSLKNEQVLALWGGGLLQVGDEVRDVDVEVFVVGQDVFDTPDEFMAAYDEDANQRKAMVSWVTDEQDVDKLLNEAIAVCGLGKVESTKEYKNDSGKNAKGSCTVNGQQATWSVSVSKLDFGDATKLPMVDVIVSVNFD